MHNKSTQEVSRDSLDLLPQIEIVYEDQDLLVISKPAGIVTNDSKTVRGPTIQAWFHQNYLKPAGESSLEDYQDLIPSDFDSQYGSPEETFERRQGIVHRIDKDTSGVLLLAKNPGALVNLITQFRKRQVKKRYQCLVHSQPRVDSATIDAPLARAKSNRHQFKVDIEGRRAVTYYQVIKRYSKLNLQLATKWLEQRSEVEDKADKIEALQESAGASYPHGFSLVACLPKTGRTHQIRVHMSHIGHSLVGDETYTGRRRYFFDRLWCPRQFLHADWIRVTHPRSGEVMSFKADLASDLKRALSFLELSS